MRTKKLLPGFTAMSSILASIIFFGTPGAAVAQTETIVYSFNGTSDGSDPNGLVLDAFGNLYGTTYAGGAYGSVGGTVFELTPTASGGWTEVVLHNFGAHGGDGYSPEAGLIFDSAGNLYGTTIAGGFGSYNTGTIFELRPHAGGTWIEGILENFGSRGSLTLHRGNLFGTTPSGGTHGQGSIFELTPDGDGGWSKKVLHNFNNNGLDGNGPFGTLIFDTSGNLYGTTPSGGLYNGGTVFELTPQADGSWTEKILHAFNSTSTDGVYPLNGLVLDAAGNLYGSTGNGGTYLTGTVFELKSRAGGKWAEKVLYNFNFNAKDPYICSGVLAFDVAGNLYGASLEGGAYDYGAVFELTPAGRGYWTEKILHNFNRDGKDGTFPGSGLVTDTSGHLYGTTASGGAYAAGTVFEITP